ncbi:MAG: thiaminase II, partial [Duncaniella sp.]|nr:thiaminase II [Duncaniella sp.]
MKWSDEAWGEIVPMFGKILSLPFIKELTAGTLPEEKFLFYLRQDSVYLSSYVQVLAHIG